MSAIVEELWSFRGKGVRPDRIYSVSEWADTYRILPASTSAEHGRWRTSRVPFMRDVMDALNPSSPWRMVVLMKGSQIAGSECGFNWVGHIIDISPAPTMILMPTLATMKRNSRTRLDPMIAATPSLAEKVAESKSRDGSNTMLLKEFPGGLLAMAGANSTSDLRSIPICNLMLDEVDDYPRDVGGQGDVVELAIARTRNFRRRKIFMCSSPTIAGVSRIEAAYDQTQRMRLWVPCLHCGEYQILKWTNIHWEKGSPQNAWYACEHCGVCIQNHEKTEMLARYEWRPEFPDYKGDAIGFHLPSFYSPVGWLAWGEIARMWVEAGKDETKLTVIKNTVFGETWKPIGEVPDWERLFNRREHYVRNTVPGGGLVLTAGADVQKDYIQVEVVAWGRGKESWSVDYQVFAGDTADVDGPAWRGLGEFLDRAFLHESGTPLSVKCLAVDSGHNTQVVYNWCRRYPINRVIPVKGMSSLPVMVGQPKAVDVYQSGRRSRKAIKLWGVGVDVAKTELYGWLRMVASDSLSGVAGLASSSVATPSPGYCHFPGDYEEEFFRQLTGEQLQQHAVRGGRLSYEWVKIRDRNEALDCRCYARAAASMLQIDKFESHHWEKIERAIWGDRAPKVASDSLVMSGDTVIGAAARPAYARPAENRVRRVMSAGVKL